MDLTHYGKVLLPYAEDILAKVDEVQEAIRAAANPDGGTVTILFSDMSGLRFVSQLFNQFSEAENHKGININFEKIQGCERVPEMLKTDTADFMISASHYTDEIETVPFIKQQLYVMVSANHPLASKRSVTIPELANWKDIIAISAGDRFTMGLKADNSVVAEPLYSNVFSEGLIDFDNWKDIVNKA